MAESLPSPWSTGEGQARGGFGKAECKAGHWGGCPDGRTAGQESLEEAAAGPPAQRGAAAGARAGPAAAGRGGSGPAVARPGKGSWQRREPQRHLQRWRRPPAALARMSQRLRARTVRGASRGVERGGARAPACRGRGRREWAGLHLASCQVHRGMDQAGEGVPEEPALEPGLGDEEGVSKQPTGWGLRGGGGARSAWEKNGSERTVCSPRARSAGCAPRGAGNFLSPWPGVHGDVHLGQTRSPGDQAGGHGPHRRDLE